MKTKLMIIAVAFIFIFTVVPCSAKGPKAKGPKNDRGDVFNYEFGTVNLTAETIELCWELDGTYGAFEAEKFALEVFGTLDFSFGTAEPVVGDEIKIGFGTIEQCISIPLVDIVSELEEYFWDEYGLLPEELNDYTFDMSAKVKGLDPHRKEGKKRQNNWFSVPVEIGIFEWTAE